MKPNIRTRSQPKLSGFFIVLLAVLFSDTVGAEIYKLVGPDGKITYSDTPPDPQSGKSETLKIQTWSGAANVSTSGMRVGTVTILSAEWCGVCRNAKAYMRTRNIPFEEWDIDRSDFARAKMRELGARGVPVILVGKQKMVGFSAEQLESMLKQQQ